MPRERLPLPLNCGDSKKAGLPAVPGFTGVAIKGYMTIAPD